MAHLVGVAVPFVGVGWIGVLVTAHVGRWVRSAQYVSRVTR